MKIILRAAAGILVLALAIFAAIPLQRAEIDRSNWMSLLGQRMPLNAVIIPGTHDSGALYSIADVSGKCQTLTVADQLQIVCGAQLCRSKNEICRYDG